MPFYEYACENCDHELEALQKISEEPLVYCPECGTGSLKKKISASKFVLKGSGWYETDFKHGNKKKDKESDSSNTKSDSSDTKSDKSESGSTQKETKSSDSASASNSSSGSSKKSDSSDASANT